MFKKLSLTITFHLIILAGLFSQHIESVKKNTPKTATATKKYKAEYEPKTVVFKIKREYKERFEREKEKFAPLANISNEIKITAFDRMFPNCISPSKPTNHLGQPLVDLSVIYVLKYSSDISVEKVSAMIRKAGFAEYAEPKFIDHLMMLPNDPFVQPGADQDFYFTNMKAFEAFDVEDGDTNVVIGIIDTGVKWDHEDLDSNIKKNWFDPIDGVDNDGDGYVDNFHGWDLGGAESGPLAGIEDNDPYAPAGNEHGTIVAGCASACTNNGLGVAGTGYKCKILPLKASTDTIVSSINAGYPAIVYAAEHDCDVINLSWGGHGSYSSTAQDVINYAAINHDVVVVAAAGNDPFDWEFYPASYDNVLSVAALGKFYHAGLDSVIETKAGFATYNYTVDICAQGRQVASTSYGGYSNFLGGSSFASPLVAGAAGILRSKYPSLNALQIAELLRITADPLIDTIPENIEFKNEKLGKGRVNMYRALTDNILPSIRMYNHTFSNKVGAYAFSDDTVRIKCKFRNYLQPTNNATVTLSTINPNVTIVKASNTLGVIPTLDSTNNIADPFIIYVKPTAGTNETVIFRLGYDDPALNYHDFQYFSINVNPEYIDIDTNLIDLTVTSNGRFGFTDEFSSTGSGFVYKNQSILYEGGLMISRNSIDVSSCVRGDFGITDFDFTPIKTVKYVPSHEGDMETYALLTDVLSLDSVDVVVQQRSYAHKSSPDDKYIIVEYDITNISGNTIDSMNVGIFNDWDIQNYNQNKCNWDVADSIGYTYYTGVNGKYAGICLLTNNAPACYSIDHVMVGGNNIDLSDGFSAAEKHQTLSSGIGRPKAGGTGTGYDVSQVVGGVVRNILNNETRTIAFAYVAGDDLADLKTSARRAKNLFRSFNTSALPTASDLHFCKGDTTNVTITPGNGSKFNFYQNATDVNPVHSGSSYTINNEFTSDTIYVKGADSLFESSNFLAKIIFHNEINADFGFAPDTLDLSVLSYVYFVDRSDNALHINWDMGDGTTINDDDAFMHQFSANGTYKVILKATDMYGCVDTISKKVVVIGTPNTGFPYVQDGIKMYPNPTTDVLHMDFIYSTPQNLKVSVYNTLGETLFNEEYSDIMVKSTLIDLSTYQKGIYYARIQIGDKAVTRIFVLQ